MTNSLSRSSFVPHIPELDGLRGILALWVLVYHVLTISEAFDALPLQLGRAIDGKHAVDVFIIMSGFVITRLIIVSRERYMRFIFRRFLRLYPTYAIAIALSVILQLIGRMPVRISEKDIEAYAVSHTTLLFSALPLGVPGSGNAVLNPTWSISLEWQFYLIAPLLVGMIFRSLKSAFIASGICVLGSKVLLPLLLKAGVAFSGGFLLYDLQLFWVGIVSFALYKYFLKDKIFAQRVLLLVTFGVLFFLPYLTNLGLLIWIGVLLAVFFAHSVLNRVLGSNKLIYLGTISYPIYLLHEPIIWLIKSSVPELQGFSLAIFLLVSTLMVCLPFSAGIHVFVEKPIIGWGKGI